MWEWKGKLKLGKSSAFIKRDIRGLPHSEAEFEADYFLNPEYSTDSPEAWNGVVIERNSSSGRRRQRRRQQASDSSGSRAATAARRRYSPALYGRF